jgi:hypothetical protein
MKTLKRTLYLPLFVIALTLFIHACSQHDPSPEEVYLKKLSTSWKIQSATADGMDVSAHFSGLALQLKGNYSYHVTNAVIGLWPANGSFQLVPVSEGVYNIIRSDGMLLTTTLSDTELGIKFQYRGLASGRISSVSGQFEFTFRR